MWVYVTDPTGKNVAGTMDIPLGTETDGVPALAYTVVGNLVIGSVSWTGTPVTLDPTWGTWSHDHSEGLFIAGTTTSPIITEPVERVFDPSYPGDHAYAPKSDVEWIRIRTIPAADTDSYYQYAPLLYSTNADLASAGNRVLVSGSSGAWIVTVDEQTGAFIEEAFVDYPPAPKPLDTYYDTGAVQDWADSGDRPLFRTLGYDADVQNVSITVDVDGVTVFLAQTAYDGTQISTLGYPRVFYDALAWAVYDGNTGYANLVLQDAGGDHPSEWTDLTDIEPYSSFESPGHYSVVATSDVGYTVATYLAGLTAAFTWELDPSGRLVHFDASPSSGAVSWTWDFNDTADARIEQPTEGEVIDHQFFAYGPFLVTLTVTDANGQTASDTETVDLAATAISGDYDNDRCAFSGAS